MTDLQMEGVRKLCSITHIMAENGVDDTVYEQVNTRMLSAIDSLLGEEGMEYAVKHLMDDLIRKGIIDEDGNEV